MTKKQLLLYWSDCKLTQQCKLSFLALITFVEKERYVFPLDCADTVIDLNVEGIPVFAFRLIPKATECVNVGF